MPHHQKAEQSQYNFAGNSNYLGKTIANMNYTTT